MEDYALMAMGGGRGTDDSVPGIITATAYDTRACALSQAAALPAVVATVAYGALPQQVFEVYRPPGDLRQLPVLVFLHGGAWIAGGLAWLRFMAGAVTRQPAVFVALSYRLAPEHRWPAQLEDLVDAMRAIRATVPLHGGDPQRMVLAGHSAGGHIAAMGVLRQQVGPLLACMPVSSPMDLRYGRVASAEGAGRVYRYLLVRPEDDGAASPICCIAGNRTPFHLTWGEYDFERIIDSGRRMVQALRGDGQAATHWLCRGAGHFETHLRLHDPEDEWYRIFRTIVQAADQPCR